MDRAGREDRHTVSDGTDGEDLGGFREPRFRSPIHETPTAPATSQPHGPALDGSVEGGVTGAVAVVIGV